MPVTISATVPERLRREVLHVAQARGETMADVMRHALSAYLAELREQAEDVRFADEIEARIERGESHYRPSEEVWAELEELEAQGALPA
jgi:predicted DNA-binding protein